MLRSHWYFAYGSNMNPARVQKRGLRIEGDAMAGFLANYRLRFNKRSRKNPCAGHANIEPDFSSRVEGVLYPLCDDREIEKMDPFESAPNHYRRELVFIQGREQLVLAWTYIANDSVVDNALSPPQWYINHLLEGSEFLSNDYIEFIRHVECLADSSSEPA